MGVARCERVERLRRDRIKQRVDWICVGGLYAGVRLKTKPSRVFLVDVVVDADRLHLFVVIAGVRDALPVRATVSIRWFARGRSAVGVKRTSEYRERRAIGVSVKANICW